MAKKRASLYFNNEVAGNGGTRYVKGTQPGKHSPISQENVHLTKSYKQFIPQLMCGTSTVIDPNSAQASQPWLYNTIPRFTQVNVIRDDKGNITTVFNILKENTITNGVYSVAVRNVEDQAPVTIVIASQWVEDKDKDKWRYYRNGDFVTADWVQIGEKWYYIGADQYMVTGPHIIDGKQYYFKKKEEDLENKNNYGQMIAHKWWRINNTWYYFHSDGSRLYSGWRLDAKGTDWYYCGADGKMVENKVIPWSDGKLYYVGSSGAMVKSAKVTDTDTGKTYKADGNGVLSEVSNSYSEEDYNYMVAIGTECPTYDGFLAVAYSVINRAKERGQSVREVVTAKNQYGGFRQSEVGNPKNAAIKKAAIDALSGASPNPIDKATFFFGKINNYDLWYESTKCHYIKEVEKNIFYVTQDFGFVHNMTSKKTNDAVVIYSASQTKWLKRGLILS